MTDELRERLRLDLEILILVKQADLPAAVATKINHLVMTYLLADIGMAEPGREDADVQSNAHDVQWPDDGALLSRP